MQTGASYSLIFRLTSTSSPLSRFQRLMISTILWNWELLFQ